MRTARFHNPGGEAQARDRWLLSYADLVTLLLGLFIVLYAASDAKRAQQIAASFSEPPAGDGILDGNRATDTETERLKQLLSADPSFSQKAKMRNSKDGLVVSLSEAGFFAAGESAIDPATANTIDAIAATLRSSAVPVRIEGHTDSTPISTSRFPSNWELSTARASSVLARLIEQGIAPERLSAAGFAGFRPVEDNATPEGRAQNRRVDIVFLTH